jgi:hypothetical protein
LHNIKYKEETSWNAVADGIVMIHPVTILHTLFGILFILLAIVAWILLFFPV